MTDVRRQRELRDILVGEVSLVDAAANRRRLLLLKREGEGMAEEESEVVRKIALNPELEAPLALAAAALEAGLTLSLKTASKGTPMIDCKKCGAENPASAKECAKCGATGAAFMGKRAADDGANDDDEDDQPQKGKRKAAEGGETPKGAAAESAGVSKADLSKVIKRADGTYVAPGVEEPLAALLIQVRKSQDENAALQEQLKATNARVEKAAADLTAERDARETERLTARVEKSMGNVPGKTADKVRILTAVRKSDSKLADEIEGLLVAASKTANIFAMMGGEGGSGGPDTAVAKMAEAIKGKVTKGEGQVSEAQAIAELMDEQPELYEQYEAERVALARAN